jgi:hypothetical protein
MMERTSLGAAALCAIACAAQFAVPEPGIAHQPS